MVKYISLLTHAAIVFDNKAFTMRQVRTHEEAYVTTDQPYPIYCGENIKLYRQ